MSLRESVLRQTAHLKGMREKGKLDHHAVTFTNDKCIWRHKDNSVTILPMDGSYIRSINPSWYEGDQLNSIL